MKKFITYLFWIYTALLLVINLIPDLPTPELERDDGLSFQLDYLLHFIMYFAGGILLYYYRTQKKAKVSGIIWLGAFMLYAGCNEAIQLIVPGRSFNPVDLGINLISVIPGYFLMHLLSNAKAKN